MVWRLFRDGGLCVCSLASRQCFFLQSAGWNSIIAVINDVGINRVDRGRTLLPDLCTGFAVDKKRKNVRPRVVADAIEHSLSLSNQGRIEFRDGHAFTLCDWLAERYAFRRNNRGVATAAQRPLQFLIRRNGLDLFIGKPARRVDDEAA